MRKHVRSIRWVLWLVVLALLAWVLGNTPISTIGSILSRLTLGQLLGLVLLNLGILVLFSGRWWLILRAQGYRLPYFSLVGYRLAGFGLSYFTPGPQFGGEPLQVYLLRSRHAIPTTTAIAAVGLDKMLELLANFAFLLLGVTAVIQNGLSDEAVLKLALLPLGLSFILPLGYLLSLRNGRQPATWLHQRALNHGMIPVSLVKALQTLAVAEEEISLFCRRNGVTLFYTQVVSVVIWIATLGEYWLTMRLLGLHLDLMQTITLLTAFRLAFLSPTPGGLGVLEAGQALAVRALGFDPAFGVGFSLLARARDVVFGGFGLWLGGMLAARPVPNASPSEASD